MKIAIAAVLVAATATAAWAQNSTTPPAAPPAKAPAAPKAPAAKDAPAAAAPVFVLFKTDRGDIALELDPVKAPITVANFLSYVKTGFYNGTVIHRSEPGFVIQGGGFDSEYTQKPTAAPIKNEWTNGLKNVRGSISMARLPSPDSATSQFFLNLQDNRALDGASGGPGYAVFGQIVRGLDVMDAIAASPTSDKSVTDLNGGPQNMHHVPVPAVTILSATVVSEADAKGTAPAGGAKPAAPAQPAAPGTTAPTAPPAPPAAPAASPPPAAMAADTPAEAAVRGLMMAVLAGDEAAVRKLTIPNPNSKILWGGEAPPKEMVEMARAQMQQMKLRECKVGEVFELGSGKSITVTDSMVSSTSKVVAPDMVGPGRIIPLTVALTDGTWKVDAGPIIEARMASLKMMSERAAKQP